MVKSATKLIVWSDGGPAHYKCKRTIYMFGELQFKYGVPITWYFFASHHGKSLCDSHTGLCKQHIKRMVMAKYLKVTGIGDISTAIKQLKNTTVYQLQQIRDHEQYEVATSIVVKSQHKFEYQVSDEGRVLVGSTTFHNEEVKKFNQVTLLANNGDPLRHNYCLFCDVPGHNHRICERFDDETKKEDFDPDDYCFHNQQVATD